jgi:Uncharacterized conserved protein
MENNLLEKIAERFGQHASVKNVFGEAIETQGKTIIPVARVAMGLGGGHGRKMSKENLNNEINQPEGEGAGGGLMTTAKGVYEITGKCTRFIPANATMQYIAIAAFAYLAGRLIGRKKR